VARAISAMTTNTSVVATTSGQSDASKRAWRVAAKSLRIGGHRSLKGRRREGGHDEQRCADDDEDVCQVKSGPVHVAPMQIEVVDHGADAQPVDDVA